ncbi:MAG: hypothetical protein QOI76_1968 [Frankiales bacterium]|jgi:hypothetical protein|nr:hypothetical protein [Frankiales bacterium]
MPYPVGIGPKVVRDLQRKFLTALDEHLLWAFNPQYPQPRSHTAGAAQR